MVDANTDALTTAAPGAQWLVITSISEDYDLVKILSTGQETLSPAAWPYLNIFYILFGIKTTMCLETVVAVIARKYLTVSV